jgi:glycosyltransferase involved in cell wall biosynthesis
VTSVTLTTLPSLKVPAVGQRPSRVLHAIHSLSGGGAETQLRMLLNGWPFQDFEAAVFYVSGDDADISNPAVKRYMSRHQSTRHLDFVGSLRDAIDDFDPDIVQIWLPESVAIPAMLIGRLRGKRVILSYRGRRSFSRPLTYVEAILAMFCVDSIVSNHEVETASSYAGSYFRWLFRRKHGCVVRNGITGDFVRFPLVTPEQSPIMRFICVGRLTALKNYPRLIEAFRILGDRSDWVLDIWGEGECRSDLQLAIKSAGLEERILLRGYCEAVQTQMVSATALILPSLSEGMPNVLVEAMALGLPVIAADIDGIREVVGSELACVWVDPLDPRDIASGIRKVLDGNVQLPDLVAAGRAIAARYSIAEAQHNWRRVYRGLLVSA